MDLGTLVATLGVNAAGLQAAAVALDKFERKAQSTMRRVSKQLEATGKTMKTFGRNMSMYVTAPLALVGRGAFNLYKDFESSMTKIVGLVGVAREQVDQWSRDILEMAPRLGKAPAELADALFFVTSAGIRGAEAMDVLEMSAKASAAGLGETKVVADLVTSAMNAYGVANLSAAQATDVLVATVREGKAQADALAGSMGMVLPIASYMGVTFDQVGGAIAAMTRTGTNAATASVQLRQILNSLIKPTQQAEEALIGMKTSSAELRKTIKEDGLLAALMKVRELTNKYGEDTMAKVFPNIRALSGVLDIMGKNIDDNIKIFASVEKAAGSLDVAFGEASKTLEFKWNQAMSASKVALTELGKSLKTALVPILNKVIERLQRVTDWFRSLHEGTQQMIIRVGLLVAAIGPLSLILGTLVGNVLPGLIKLVMGVAKAFRVLTVAMMTNPLILLATALAGVVVGLTVLARRLKEAKKAQMDFAEISDKAAQSTLEQGKAVEQLFSIAQNEKKSLDERTAALKALHSASKEYFGDLTLETLATEEGTKAKQAYITELLREAKVKAAMDELVRLEKERYRQIEQLEGARLKFGQKVGAVIVGTIRGQTNAAVYAAKKGTKNLQEMEKQLDATEQKTKEFLENLITAEDIETLFGGMTLGDEVVTQAEKIGMVMKTLGDETEYAANMYKALGGEFDMLQSLIAANQEALDGLIRSGLDPLSEKVQEVVANIRQLEMLQDFAAEATKLEKALDKAFDLEFDKQFADVMREMRNEMYGVDAAIEESILKSHNLKEALIDAAIGPELLKNAFRGMSNVISNALNETENVLQAFGKFFWDFIKGMIIKLIAATIAALALAVVLTFIIPGYNAGKIFTGLTEGAKFGEVFGAGLKSFAGFADLSAPFTIPPGHPNDSFLAAMSTGETILPKGYHAQSQMGGEVVFRIEGDELVGILEKRISVGKNF